MADNLTGATTAIFTVSLSVTVAEPVDVAWSTKDGTAKAGTDYEAANGVLTFQPGELNKQIEVTVYGANAGATGDKKFYIKLNPPTNAVLVDSLIDCTITVTDESGVPVTSIVVAQGKRGLKGDPGMSAYEHAVLMGYQGTVEEWMEDQASAARAADRATDAIVTVEAAASRAEAAAASAAFAGKIYPTPEAGVDPITGAANGYFYNVRSTSGDSFIDEYQNVNGVPVSTGKTYPSGTALSQVKVDSESNKKAIADYNISLTSISELRSSATIQGDTVGIASYFEGLGIGGGMFYADLTDTVSIDNGVNVIVANNGKRWKRISNIIDFAMAGCIGSGDETTPLKRLFSALANTSAELNDQSGKEFLFSSDILVEAPFKEIKIDSNCTLKSSTNKLIITGTIAEIGTITENASKGAKSVTASSVNGLNAGDVIILHNTRLKSFALHRDYYTDGEFKVVESVTGNIIKLSQFLETSYTTADANRIYKVSPVFASIKGLKCVSHGASAFTLALSYKSKVDFYVSNLLNASNSNNAMLFDRVYDSDILGGEYIKKGISGTGTDYGICFSNCQDIRNNAKYCYGGRHGVATGGTSALGSVPNRRVNSVGVKIENDPSSLLHAADFHGNIADSYYQECVIFGRISLSGFNTSSRKNTIYGNTADVRPPIGYGEVVGGCIESVGDIIMSSGGAAGLAGWLSSAQVENTSKPATFKIQDLKFYGNSALIGIIAITNMPFDSKCVIDGFELLDTSKTMSRLVTYNAGSELVKPSYIQITRPAYSVPEDVLYIAGGATLTTTVKNVFSSSGSNENGSWIKQSDGSMICRHRVATTLPIDAAVAGGFKSANIQWTMPKAFNAVPTIMTTGFDNSSFSLRVALATATVSQIYSINPVVVANAGIVFDVVAIGRHLS